METLIIHPTPAAADCPSHAVRLAKLLVLAFASVLTILNPLAAQKTPGGAAIDLTTPEPEHQRGLGVPGASGGGTSAGPLEMSRYELPLRTEIIRTSVSKAGDFILELQLENTGQAVFDLPVSRNISDVQRTLGSSRREFFFHIRPASSEGRDVEAVGFAVTAGSESLPGSLISLKPRESVRVLLRAESNRVKKAMPNGARHLDVRVVCGEWALEDNRFFIRATAQDLASTNTAVLRLGDDTPVIPTSRR